MKAAVACSTPPPLPLAMLPNDSSTHSFFLGRNSLGVEQILGVHDRRGMVIMKEARKRSTYCG